MDPDIALFEGKGKKEWSGTSPQIRCVSCMKSEEEQLCRNKYGLRFETPALEEAAPYPLVDIVQPTLSHTRVANGL